MKFKVGNKYTIQLKNETLHVKLFAIDQDLKMLLFIFLTSENPLSGDIIIDYTGNLDDNLFYSGSHKVTIKEGIKGEHTLKEELQPKKSKAKKQSARKKSKQSASKKSKQSAPKKSKQSAPKKSKQSALKKSKRSAPKKSKRSTVKKSKRSAPKKSKRSAVKKSKAKKQSASKKSKAKKQSAPNKSKAKKQSAPKKPKAKNVLLRLRKEVLRRR